MVAAATLLALLAIWPTAHEMSGGRVPCPQYIKDRVSFRLVAGLDLRGGLRLVYTVDVEEAIRDKRDRYYEEMRQMLAVAYGLHEGDKPPSRDALAKLFEKVEMVKQRADASTIVLNLKDADPAKIEEIYNKRFFHDMSMLKEDTGKTYTFTLKTDVESVIRERAVLQAKETVNRRVDELGLREASVVVRDEDIIIEVPGQDDKQFQQIRDIISRTARLEFKILDDDQDFVGSIKKKLTDDTKLAEGVSLDNLENAPVGVGKTSPIHYATVEKKPDEQLRDALLRLKGFLEQFPPPNDRELGYGVIYDTDPETFRQTEKGWRTYFLHARADITGDQIQDASAQPDQDSSMGGWHVALTFTDSGGDRFEEITGANVKRRFAIILDNKVESAPVIQTKIAGGHAQITMGAADTQTQLEESRQLELVLRSGALPAPIVPSNEQRIGASLGEDSVREGVRATIVGALLVLIFMVVYYSRAGLIADIAVLGNMLLQLAVLSSLGASMTLPGIAGLALTLGMSVDANVLVNERIREELRAGKSPRVAVEAGYDKAFSAIIDGNLTTVLSALVLAQYGTGPIKGFAVTLLVGLIANLFTAVFATRVIFDYLVRARKVKTLRIG
jgi:preprotein translocase subunit SecD